MRTAALLICALALLAAAADAKLLCGKAECPFSDGVCCGTQAFCCPAGYQCHGEGKQLRCKNEAVLPLHHEKLHLKVEHTEHSHEHAAHHKPAGAESSHKAAPALKFADDLPTDSDLMGIEKPKHSEHAEHSEGSKKAEHSAESSKHARSEESSEEASGEESSQKKKKKHLSSEVQWMKETPEEKVWREKREAKEKADQSRMKLLKESDRAEMLANEVEDFFDGSKPSAKEAVKELDGIVADGDPDMMPESDDCQPEDPRMAFVRNSVEAKVSEGPLPPRCKRSSRQESSAMNSESGARVGKFQAMRFRAEGTPQGVIGPVQQQWPLQNPQVTAELATNGESVVSEAEGTAESATEQKSACEANCEAIERLEAALDAAGEPKSEAGRLSAEYIKTRIRLLRESSPDAAKSAQAAREYLDALANLSSEESSEEASEESSSPNEQSEASEESSQPLDENSESPSEATGAPSSNEQSETYEPELTAEHTHSDKLVVAQVSSVVQETVLHAQ